MTDIRLTFPQMAVERLTVDIEINKDTFVQDAANQIALALIANGCLIHHSEYDIAKQIYKEVIHIHVGKKDMVLPR